MRLLSGMLGLGDNIYQRAVVRELGAVHLVTSWPQLYADLPGVRCVRPTTRLRTQSKNAARDDLTWSTVSRGTAPRRIGYDGRDTILASLMRSAGIAPARVTFDGPPVEAREGRYILVRPATVRTEWPAASRNPAPGVIARAVDMLRDDYTVISVADLEPGAEEPAEALPFAHHRFHHGELLLEDLLELVAGAAGVIGGVGWLVPAAVAYQVPMLLLYGGWGAMNGPQRIFDPRMDVSKVVQAKPDHFCMCDQRAHRCDKTISNLERHVEAFVRIAERKPPAMAA